MKNKTNIIKYKYLAAIYDTLFSPILLKARKEIFKLLNLKVDDDLLLVGIGTGLDLPFLPKDCFITGVDLSEDMLRKARLKIKQQNVELYNMNAECLQFEDRTFDYVVLNLILSVAEKPDLVIQEAIRVLNDQGIIVVFDKFIKGKNSCFLRKLLNTITSFIGTDITRCFETIISGLPVCVIQDIDSIFGGNYRIIQLQKIPD